MAAGWSHPVTTELCEFGLSRYRMSSSRHAESFPAISAKRNGKCLACRATTTRLAAIFPSTSPRVCKQSAFCADAAKSLNDTHSAKCRFYYSLFRRILAKQILRFTHEQVPPLLKAHVAAFGKLADGG